VAKKCKILATFQKPTSDSGKLPFSVNRTRLEATSANERMVRRSPVPWPTAILFLRHRRVSPTSGAAERKTGLRHRAQRSRQPGLCDRRPKPSSDVPEMLAPAPGVYSKGDFIRMLETRGWGRCQRQKRDAPAERFDGNERRLRNEPDAKSASNVLRNDLTPNEPW
jgi:hypothetical protein